MTAPHLLMPFPLTHTLNHCGSTHPSTDADADADATTLAVPPCNVVYDPPTEIRVGSDAKTVQLPSNGTIHDCGASCCADPNCLAFSFNTFANGDAPVCKHKDSDVKPQSGNGCPLVKGLPSCMSGGIPNKTECNGQTWAHDSCPPEMPGPNADCASIPICTHTSISCAWSPTPQPLAHAPATLSAAITMCRPRGSLGCIVLI
jgi:hypothetical protein